MVMAILEIGLFSILDLLIGRRLSRQISFAQEINRIAFNRFGQRNEYTNC